MLSCLGGFSIRVEGVKAYFLQQLREKWVDGGAREASKWLTSKKKGLEVIIRLKVDGPQAFWALIIKVSTGLGTSACKSFGFFHPNWTTFLTQLSTSAWARTSRPQSNEPTLSFDWHHNEFCILRLETATILCIIWFRYWWNELGTSTITGATFSSCLSRR